MAQLQISKVITLPSTLTPSTLYLVQASNNRFSMYLTDKLGEVHYRSPDSADISAIVLALINALKDQPGGLASLDSLGHVTKHLDTITALDGQNGLIITDTGYPWYSKPVSLYWSGSSANDPSRIVLFGNMQGLSFAGGVMTQSFPMFQVPHDIAEDSSVYVRVHWTPAGSLTGNVRWGLEYSVQKGYNQGSFPATTIIYASQALVPSDLSRNFTTEFAEIASTDIEPNSTILVRIFRDGTNSLDTYTGNVSAWQIGFTYQRARIGTRNRAPNFYT